MYYVYTNVMCVSIVDILTYFMKLPLCYFYPNNKATLPMVLVVFYDAWNCSGS